MQGTAVWVFSAVAGQPDSRERCWASVGREQSAAGRGRAPETSARSSCCSAERAELCWSCTLGGCRDFPV